MTTETRQHLRQMHPGDVELQRIWQEMPDSDPDNHLNCGYIPTGQTCPACKKTLGPALSQESSYQIDFLSDDHMTVMATGGEQSGKSHSGSMKMFQIIMNFIGEYGPKAAGEVAWIVADSYELTYQEFRNLTEWLKSTPLKVRPSKKVDPGTIIVNVPGGVFTIKTRSANDAQTLRAESPIATLVCEAALLSLDAYERLISRVARARSMYPGYGGIILSGTLEGSLGWYPTVQSKWTSPAVQEKDNSKSFSIPMYSNIFAFDGTEQDPAIQTLKAEMTEDKYNERVKAIPSPPSGRVHSGFDPTIHIQKTEYDANVPVMIGIDPGYSGRSSTYAVETVQRRPRPCKNQHFWVTHEIFEREHTVEQICGMAMHRPWWKNEHKTAVVDIAGEAHAGAMESNVEVWLKKTGLILMNQRVLIRPGIDKFDSMLLPCPECHEPYLVFDPECVGVISELGGTVNPFDGQVHVYSWQKDRTGNVVGGNPRDEYCDGIKALTYLFVNQHGYANFSGTKTKIKVKRHRRKVA